MRPSAVAGALVVFGVAGPAPAAPQRTFETGVVGLTVTYQKWDEIRPWIKSNPATRRGHGVVLEGGRILTTAQIVAGATLVELEALGRGLSATARVAVVSREADLALLTVEDAAALAGLRPVKLVDRTPTEGVLRTVRWDGQQLESAASRLRRFEVRPSAFGGLEHAFLLVQTDISGGGWAEPVFAGDRLVGLTANQEEQRARVIPAEILSEFLSQASSASPDRGFPGLGIEWQPKEGAAASAYFGQTGSPRGVLVDAVAWGSSACGVLRARDVLLAIDGHEIDGDGYYSHPRFGRLRLENIVIDGKAVGDVVAVRVIRDRKTLDLRMTLRSAAATMDLMPEHRADTPPPYVVAGGLIFRELDGEYLAAWGEDWRRKGPMPLVTRFTISRQAQTPEHRRVIILSAVLPAPYNVGYQDLRDLVVDRINGRPIGSIGDVVQAFAHAQGGLHTVAFAPNGARREAVLDAEALEAATAAILEHYRVPARVRLLTPTAPGPSPPCEP